MKYGDIHWAKPDSSVGSEQTGRRPVLVVSCNKAIEAIPNLVTTVPLTTRDRGWATHVHISGESTGLEQPTWAICEQVRTISTARIAGRIGEADASTLARVTQILRYLLNL